MSPGATIDTLDMAAIEKAGWNVHDAEGWIVVMAVWSTREERRGVAAEFSQKDPDARAVAEAMITRAKELYAGRAAEREAATRSDFVRPGTPANVHCETSSILDVSQDSQDSQSPKASQASQRLTTGSEDDKSQAEVLPEDVEKPSAANERARWFASFVTKPFGDFIAAAWEYAHAQDSLWPPPLFWFVYFLRGHAELEQHLDSPNKAMGIVESYLKSWQETRRRQNRSCHYELNHEQRRTNDHWQAWFGMPRVEARQMFSDCWQSMRYRPGHGPLEQAVVAARQLRLKLDDHVAAAHAPEHPDDAEKCYSFFVSVAGHLQVIMGDKPILLPGRKLGELMGVSQRTVARYCLAALRDGYLTLTKREMFRSAGMSQAAEYRFDVGHWPCLSERAQRGSVESFDGPMPAPDSPGRHFPAEH